MPDISMLDHVLAVGYAGDLLVPWITLDNPNPDLPADAVDPLNTIFAWGKGLIVALGVIGILFAAGKMAMGKFGRSDLAADGVGSLLWVVFGISLMLVAIPLIREFV